MIAFLIAGLLQSSAIVPASPVTFSQQKPEAWGVNLTASGLTRTSDSSVVIELDGIRVSVPAEKKYSWHSAGYRVCLAYNKSPEVWDFAGCSKPVQARFNLKPGEVKMLPSQKLEISIKDYPAIENFWLVMELSSTPRRGKQFTIYSHSGNLPKPSEAGR